MSSAKNHMARSHRSAAKRGGAFGSMERRAYTYSVKEYSGRGSAPLKNLFRRLANPLRKPGAAEEEA